MLVALLQLIGTTALVANDFCSTASMASDGLNSANNAGALLWPQGYYQDARDIWFKYNASTTGSVTLTTTATPKDILVVVYYGGSCNMLYPAQSGNLYIAEDSDDCDVTWNTIKNQMYYISFGSASSDGSDSGPFTFTITPTGATPPAVGGLCSSPAAVPATGVLTIDNTGAADPAPFYFYEGTYGVWASYTANCTGTASASTTATFETAIQAYYDQRCSSIQGLPVRADGDDGSCPSVSFPVMSGSTYILSVGSYDYFEGPGSITLTVACTTYPRAANDVCPAAANVTTGTQFSIDNTDAMTDFNQNLCQYQGDDAPQNDVWVTWNSGACAGVATLHINYTEVAVLQGSCLDGALVHCDDSDTHSWPTVANQVHQIAIGSGMGTGIYVGTISCTNTASVVPMIPPNSGCSGAATVTDGTLNKVNNTGAITDPGTQFAIGTPYIYECSYLHHQLFFSYVAACTGQITLTANSSLNQVTFALYADNMCTTNEPPVYCEYDITTVTWNASAFETYTFALGFEYESDPTTEGIWFTVMCNGTAAPPPTGVPSLTPTGFPSTNGASSNAPSMAPSIKGTTLTPSQAPTTTSTPSTKKTTTAGAGVLGFGLVSFLGLAVL